MAAKMERQSDRHPKNLLNSLEKLQMNGKLCDVTVAIGDKEMRVHRMILVAASEYFEAMFMHETKESRTRKIEFPSTPPEIAKLCMDFIYTGKAEFSLENPEELIHASDMMQLHDLTDLYIEFLIENLNVENCAEFLMLALTYGKNILKKPIENFILNSCPDFTKARKFELLSKDHLLYCLKLLPKANKTSEAHKWKAIIAWITYDTESRKSSFEELFKLLHLSVFSKEFLKDEIYEEQLVKESHVCSNMMLERFMAKETTSSLTLAEESFDFENLYAINSSGQALLQYSCVTKEWSKYADMPKDISTLSNADLEVINGTIYIGFGNSLWKCANMKWRRLYLNADRRKKRCFNRCVACGSSVYMITSDDVIEYNFSNGRLNEASRISYGPYLSSNFAVTCASGGIYAVGVGAAYKFNFFDKSWQQIGNLISRRKGRTVFCFDGKPYVLGGICSEEDSELEESDCEENVDSVEFYEPATDRWYVVPDLKITCTDAKVYIRDKLYIILPGFKFHQIELSKLQVRVRKGFMDANVDPSKVCIGF